MRDYRARKAAGLVDPVSRAERVDVRAREADPSWRQQAACRGMPPDLFFTDRGYDTGTAKKVCAGCPVRDACLTYALDTGVRFGVWGGLSEKQRKRLRRGRGRRVAS